MADSGRKAAAAAPVAAVPVRDLPDRGRVVCHGFIESVTYMPANQVASFTAIVTDHDAPPPVSRLRVVWLGRRRIPGVDAGTELRLEGMVTVRDGLPTIFNPRYEILSRQEEP